jgi:hypothetical protein
MSESTLWSYMKRGMGNAWDAQRHEDRCASGVPDISYGIKLGSTYRQGWIELKCILSWPKLTKTPVVIPHFTVWQRRWLKRRCYYGAACWLLLRVDSPREYLLFTAADAASFNAVGVNLTQEEMWAKALCVWSRTIDFLELRAMLCF